MAPSTGPSHADYKDKPFLATDAIGRLLGMSRLNLFLGAGISKGFGLPDWTMLIARILGKDGDAAFVADLRSKSSSDQIQLLDAIDDGGADYFSKIHGALYRDVKSSLLEQLQQSPLLLAVGALVTGSCRGRISVVYTYNYDDLLEQYLRMLGYEVCVRISPTAYSSRADVEINHVHGYLPQSWKRGGPTEDIVLSKKSYRKRNAHIDEGWSAAVENSTYGRTPILMGISGDDDVMHTIFERAKDKIKRNEDYHGYWIMTPDAYARNAATVLDVGMCPIPLPKEDLPNFVFEVCQKALK